MIRKYVKNEKGSGTVIIMVCMVLGAIFFGLLFFDFSNVFINKRVTQTGADAAAIAAAQKATTYMKEELQEQTQEKLDDLGDRWDEYVDGVLDDLEEESEAESGEAELEPALPSPPPPPPSESEIFVNFIEMIEHEFRKSMPSDIKAWLRNHHMDVNAETAMKFFFEDDEVSGLSCEAVLDNWGEVKQAAEKYAEKNQNDRLTDINFIGDEFRIYVETERSGKYTTVPDESIPAIQSDSSAIIGEPKGFEGKISCS